MKVTKVKTKNRAFYADVGPYLANRQVAKEIGYHIYDDDKTDWFVCKIDGELAAFVNCRKCAKTVVICSCYTVAEHRRKGAMQSIVRSIKTEYKQTALRVSANASSKPLFAKEGFKQLRTNGSFAVMEYENA